jgi:hypothetical protein
MNSSVVQVYKRAETSRMVIEKCAADEKKQTKQMFLNLFIYFFFLKNNKF